MVIAVNNFCKSGYGDRMIDLFIFSIYSKLMRESVHIHWVPFRGFDFTDIPQWRYIDTLRENFLNFFKLPETIQLEDNPIQSEKHFDEYLGGLTSPYNFYQRYFQGRLPLEFFNFVVQETKKEFGIHIPDFVFEKPYIVVHLRRTDKLRGVCETQINRNSEDSIENLDKKTKQRILEAKEKGYQHFYIASDSVETKQEYTDYIKSLGLTVIQPENKYNLIESYYDTWIMKSSSIILVSTKYSTYSLSCALIYDKPLLNVLTEEVYRKYNYDKHVNLIQEIPSIKENK